MGSADLMGLVLALEEGASAEGVVNLSSGNGDTILGWCCMTGL